jgi:hypothetical protein
VHQSLVIVPVFHLCLDSDWEHTSLKPYVDMLDRHVMGILDDVRRRERAKAVLQHGTWVLIYFRVIRV